MPALLQNPLAVEHGQEILRLEADEIVRLRIIYEQARLELLGRLTQLPGNTFTAQQTRLALAQTETALRAMIKKLGDQRDRYLDRQLEWSLDSTFRQIRHYEPRFRQSQGKIQTRALRKMAAHRGLLLHQYDTSMRTFGGTLAGEIQRRLAVHVVQKSSIRDMAIDIAGRLEQHSFRGARWSAERIARTELIDGLTTAQAEGLTQAETVIPGLMRQWDSTIDGRTSKVCIAWNGRVRKEGEPFGEVRGRKIFKPPALPNCRSGLQPYHPEWAERDAELARTTPKGKKPPTAAQARKEPKRKAAKRAAAAKSQASTIRTVEREIGKNTRHETAVLVDAQGNELLRKDGSKSRVGFTDAEARKFKGNVLTHNHPNGSTLSPQDIVTAATTGLAEIRAVGAAPVQGTRYVYAMEPPLKGWDAAWLVQTLVPALKEAEKAVAKRLKPLLAAKKLTREEVFLLHGHLVWKRVAKATGVRYSRRVAP